LSEDPTHGGQIPAYLCDSLQTLGVHNGVTRLGFIRLDAEGKPQPCVELLMPNVVVRQMVAALQAVKV